MKYYKFIIHSFILLFFVSNICVSPPPINGGGDTTNVGGISVPHGSLSYTIHINPSEQFRNKTLNVMFKFINDNTNREIPDIVVFGRFDENFEVVNVSSSKEMSWDQENFGIKFALGPGENREFIYYLRIKRTAELNYSKIVHSSANSKSNKYKTEYNKLINNDCINVAYNDNDIRLEIKEGTSKFENEIYIKINIPAIRSSSATIVSELHPLVIG